MRRRAFLAGGSAAAAGAAIRPARSQSPPAAGQPLAPTDIESAVARLRKQFRAQFDPAYVENVIVPYFLVSTYQGERLALPMIDVKFTKENALAPFTGSSTASHCRCATMPALRRLASAIAAVRANS
jgi:hypothetical protein